MVTAMEERQIILVYGATRGIGRAVATALAARGHTVVAGARTPRSGRDLAAELDGDAAATSTETTRLAAASADVAYSGFAVPRNTSDIETSSLTSGTARCAARDFRPRAPE